MAVSNPATFSSVQTEAGSSDPNFSHFNRGGSIISSAWSATISTTANGLALSQFNGVSKPAVALTASASPSPVNTSSSGTTTSKTMTSGITTVTPSGGTGTYSHSFSIVTYSIVTSPTLNPSGNTCSVTCTLSAGAGITNNGSVTVRDTVTSGASTTTVDVVFNFSYTNNSISCVTVESILIDGRPAAAWEVEEFMFVTDPFMEPVGNTVEGMVLKAETHRVPCVRIETANGAWLECSTTAPIPVQAGGFVLAPDLEGQQVPTALREQIGEDTVFEWSPVVRVHPIGEREVRLLYVADRCFWASGDGQRFILHHNAKQITIP